MNEKEEIKQKPQKKKRIMILPSTETEPYPEERSGYSLDSELKPATRLFLLKWMSRNAPIGAMDRLARIINEEIVAGYSQEHTEDDEDE